MIDEELIKNYKNALEQKYNAICFDIDGTLTENNSIKIDNRILPYLADILKRHIPIVFITGRGETGLKDLLSDIVDDLKNNYGITQKELLKMYALINDGARLFRTSNDSKTLFNICEYVSSNSSLMELTQLDLKIKKLLEKTELKKYCKCTYSKDLKTDAIINIRLSFLTNDFKVNDKITNIMKAMVQEFNGVNVTIGIYKGKQVFQFGTTTKDKAIKTAEKAIGIPQNSMLRIGDCGDINGNDYLMLNCSQGFSVGSFSGAKNKCFPVIENGKILTGIDGTINLLKKVKLLPTICLEHAIESDYIKEYAKTEKQMQQGKNSRILNFNNLINQKFLTINGMNDLFDISSGSVKIPMYEWFDIPENNALKKLWLTNSEFGLCYAMYDNENILLRGSRVYYYFLARRFHDKKTQEDITTKEMINEWLNNTIIFFKSSIAALKCCENLDDLNNTKMVLGLIDNLRNHLLILMNYEIINYNDNKSLLLNLKTINKNSLLYKIYDVLIEIESLMKNIVFDKNFKVDNIQLDVLLQKSILITYQFKEIFNHQVQKANYSKDFRAYREIDNFAENFITCYSTIQKDSKIFDKGICGVCYGGLELPIIMQTIENRIKDVSILKFNSNVTGYTKKQSLELRFFDIFKNGGIEIVGVDKQKSYILLNDNLLTGKTMQLVISTFYDVNIKIDKIMVVRYPGVNRINQMFMPNHGAIDFRQFFDFIEGLYFPSPYSWRDPNSLNPYEDSLGIFDLNRRKIIECLVKNGDYTKNSEVYVRRMERK